jgi:hypothetical protein
VAFRCGASAQFGQRLGQLRGRADLGRAPDMGRGLSTSGGKKKDDIRLVRGGSRYRDALGSFIAAMCASRVGDGDPGGSRSGARDPARRTAMGAAGRTWISANLGIDAVLGRIERASCSA